MKISRDNYEQYFIDYIDGTLSEQDTALLEQFLLQNPDLADELNGMNAVRLEPTHENIPSWLELKREEFADSTSISRLHYLCIANLEGDITPNEELELANAVDENKHTTKLAEQYSRLKLKPNQKITFNHKQSLYRVRIIGITRKTLINMASVAASLGLFVGIYTLSKNVEISNIELVE